MQTKPQPNGWMNCWTTKQPEQKELTREYKELIQTKNDLGVGGY